MKRVRRCCVGSAVDVLSVMGHADEQIRALCSDAERARVAASIREARAAVAEFIEAAREANDLADAVFELDNETELYGFKLFGTVLQAHGSPTPPEWHIRPYFDGNNDDARRELERLRHNASARLDAALARVGGGS